MTTSVPATDCAKCGSALAPGAPFCGACGTSARPASTGAVPPVVPPVVPSAVAAGTAQPAPEGRSQLAHLASHVVSAGGGAVAFVVKLLGGDSVRAGARSPLAPPARPATRVPAPMPAAEPVVPDPDPDPDPDSTSAPAPPGAPAARVDIGIIAAIPGFARAESEPEAKEPAPEPKAELTPEPKAELTPELKVELAGEPESAPAAESALAAEPVPAAEAPPAAEPAPAPAAELPPAPAPEPEPEDLDVTRLVVPFRPPAVPRLIFDTGEVVVVKGTGVVGRNPSAGADDAVVHLVTVPDPERSVSKTHAAFGLDAGGLWVADRSSTNGTTVVAPDGSRTELTAGERAHVTAGSVIEFGDRNARVDAP